jgi:hypothetical protein
MWKELSEKMYSTRDSISFSISLYSEDPPQKLRVSCWLIGCHYFYVWL